MMNLTVDVAGGRKSTAPPDQVSFKTDVERILSTFQMMTPTGGEDDEDEMVKESQERKSSIQVSFESEAARIDEK